MPLLKRKPYVLAEPPPDLRPGEQVFCIRYTEEVFRDYERYIQKVSMYRQRLWTCKATGKAGLTFEEALLSELEATKKVQKFPEEYIGPVLRMIQFSRIRLDELVDSIYKKYKNHYVVGEYIGVYRDGEAYKCKVLGVESAGKQPRGGAGRESKSKKAKRGKRKARKGAAEEEGGEDEDTEEEAKEEAEEEEEEGEGEGDERAEGGKSEGGGAGGVRYEVGWVDAADGQIVETSVEEARNIIRKKNPLSKGLLKAFIRESAAMGSSRSAPWVVREELAEQFDIPRTPPAGLRAAALEKKEKKEAGEKREKRERRERQPPPPQAEAVAAAALTDDADKQSRKKRAKKAWDMDMELGGELAPKKRRRKAQSDPPPPPPPPPPPVVIKYPIEDKDVKPGPDDPPFTPRPPPSTDFLLPPECTGDLLMVWDFCQLYARPLRLFPFTLDDLEKAVEHQEGEVGLLAEAHTALLRAALADSELADAFNKRSKRSQEVSARTWQEDLGDWIDKGRRAEFQPHLAGIRKKLYPELAPGVKLAMLRELADAACATDVIRAQVDENLETYQSAVVQLREDDSEERKRQKAQEEHEEEQQQQQLEEERAEGEGEEEERGQKENGGGSSRVTKGRRGRRERTGGARAESMPDAAGGDAHLEALANGHLANGNGAGEEEDEDELEGGTAAGLGLRAGQNGHHSGSHEEVSDLLGSLNPKGIRERALQRQMKKVVPRISAAIQKRAKEFAQRLAFEEAAVRRSSRVRTTPRQAPFLSYVNKYA
eukprot:jgi/Mesen1/5330/ME000266S04517